MPNQTLPLQKLPTEILSHLGINWHVCASFEREDITKVFIETLKTLFYIYEPIKSIYRTPPIWGINIMYTPEQEAKVVSFLSELHLPIFATFSYPEITQADVDSFPLNHALDLIADNPANGVVVSSDLLSDYIHNKYPELKQVSSPLQVAVPQNQRTAAFYNNLATRFDKVLIHPDDNFNLDLLASLEAKNKFEIIVNSNCAINCPHYAKCLIKPHGFLDVGERQEFLSQNCPKFKHSKITRRNNTLTNAEIDILYNMGFTNFQIMEHRDKKSETLSYDLTRYIINHNLMDGLIFDHIYGTMWMVLRDE